MKRVCIIRQTYYPKHRNLRRNAKALCSVGYQADVICLREKGEKARETISGVNVYRLPLEHHRGGVLRYLFEYMAFFIMCSGVLVALHVRKRYQLIEVCNTPDFLVFATLYPRLLGAKVIWYMFENTPQLFMSSYGVGPANPYTKLLRMCEWAAASYADEVIITGGAAYRQSLESLGIPFTKVSMVPNVPDEAVFFQSYGELPSKGTAFRVVIISSLLPRYGVQTLIKAVPIILKGVPDIMIDVIGDGEYRQTLESLARRLGVGQHLHFTGWVPQEEVPAHLRLADVAIAPMLHDVGLPNKMYDCFALKKPCVASAQPSLLKTFDESCVLFFEPGDERDLAKCILDLYRYPEKRAALGLAGYQYYQSCHWPIARGEYLKVHEKCLSPVRERSRIARDARAVDGADYRRN